MSNPGYSWNFSRIGFSLRCHQTWRRLENGWKWTIEIGDVPRNLHSIRGFSSQPCLMTPEGRFKWYLLLVSMIIYRYQNGIYMIHLSYHCLFSPCPNRIMMPNSTVENETYLANFHWDTILSIFRWFKFLFHYFFMVKLPFWSMLFVNSILRFTLRNDLQMVSVLIVSTCISVIRPI